MGLLRTVATQTTPTFEGALRRGAAGSVAAARGGPRWSGRGPQAPQCFVPG